MLAIVSTQRITGAHDASKMHEWIEYHLSTGVDLAIVFIEGDWMSLSMRSSIENRHPRRLILRTSDAADGAVSIEKRQRRNALQALLATRKRGVACLAHIDGDELLHICGDKTRLIDQVEANGAMYISNVEAVRPTRGPARFRQPIAAYTNGKGICCVQDETVTVAGVHRFHRDGEVADAAPQACDAVVLHFGGGTFEEWKRKYVEIESGRIIRDHTTSATEECLDAVRSGSEDTMRRLYDRLWTVEGHMTHHPDKELFSIELPEMRYF